MVIAAILFPRFLQARGKKLQGSCAFNMKMIGMAFGQYLSEYDGVYPTYDIDREKISGQPPEPPEERAWYTAIDPYLPSPRFGGDLRCPADASLAPAPDPDWKKEYVTSYSVNGWTEYDLKQTEVRSPASWVLMGERNNQTHGPNGPWRFYFWTWQGTPRVWPPAAAPIPAEKAAEDLALTRHSEGANWLYGDGHVKWGRFSDLWKGGSENPFWPGPTMSPSP
jgi:prepilin-type processing-associated H-X9-DG protein